MTQLARYGWLAAAKEVTPGTWLAPTFGLPYTGSSGFEDMYTTLRDESVRNNDSVLQGVYQGPAHAEWAIDLDAYPDLTGHMLCATIGPDTVAAGDRKSTRLNSSHSSISYAVFCLKKKTKGMRDVLVAHRPLRRQADPRQQGPRPQHQVPQQEE